MKKLSDYTGAEAVELWADLLDPCIKIFGNEKVSNALRSGAPKLVVAKEILKRCPDEACNVMLRIDPDTPIDGITVVARLLNLLTDVYNNPAVSPFLSSVAEASKEQSAFGSATENIEETPTTSSDM